MDPHQTKIYTAILITSFVLGTILVFFTISIVRQQRRNMKLQRLNILAEINAIDKERTRMAQDLHDELGPALTVIKFEVDSAEAVSEEDRELLRKASRQLDEAVNKVREIARNMIPSSLVRKGLQAALQEIVQQTNDHTSLHVSFSYDVSQPINQDLSINIYRMMQEVIQNAVKYSNAELLLIKIRSEERKLIIFCEDNGVGFDYEEKQAQAEGLGLRNLKSRVDLVRGNLQVASQKNKGTQYIFELPLNA
jgi:signal transduction histidine kinase